MDKNVSLEFNTTEDTRNYLDFVSQRSGISVDDLINRLIDDHLSEIEKSLEKKAEVEEKLSKLKKKQSDKGEIFY